MAITTTLAPIRPLGGAGGTVAGDIMTMPSTASEVWGDGDIVILASGLPLEDNSPAINVILGVAVTKAFTANATINPDGTIGADLIQFYPAWPGRRFAGNQVGGATTDYIGVVATGLLIEKDIIEATDANSSTFAAINTASAAAGVAFSLEYTSPQWDEANSAWKYGRHAGVGITNPRVSFVFTNTAFAPNA